MNKDITDNDLNNLIEICHNLGFEVIDADIVWSSAFLRLEDRTIALEVQNEINEKAQNFGFSLVGVISNKMKVDKLDLHFSKKD